MTPALGSDRKGSVRCSGLGLQAFEERSGSLQRQLLLQQSSLQQLREDMEVQEVEKARLQAQLTGQCSSCAE